MKVLLVIDHFGSGGAQRQIVELACGLSQRGHSVEVFIYHPQYDFFRARIDEAGIIVHEYKKSRGFSFGVVTKLSSLMRTSDTDVVVSFLNDANLYSELSKLLTDGPKLVVSERTSHHDDRNWLASRCRRLLHTLADHVVANSQTHSEWLVRRRWLRGKVSCIYNGVDLSRARSEPPVAGSISDLRLLAIGRVGREKNPINLIKALQLLHDMSGHLPRVDWVGARGSSSYAKQVERLLESLPLIRERWHWLGVRSDIPELLRDHHALVHPSLYEGLPNVVCEALAAGRPILISDVCDHPLLVANGKRGFVFDAEQPASIAEAVTMLGNLDRQAWSRFSRNARDYAAANLGVEKMVSSYENLFAGLLEKDVGFEGTRP